jgi:hypothetical protein
VKSHKYDDAEPGTVIPYPNRLNKLCDEDCTAAYLCPPCLTPPPSTTLLSIHQMFPSRWRPPLPWSQPRLSSSTYDGTRYPRVLDGHRRLVRPSL